MENENIQEKYKFLAENEAKYLFAEIDYALKNGQHIQADFPKQKDLFEFITKNYDSLYNYYLDFFDVKLDYKTNYNQKYYFIDFQEDIKGRIERPFVNLSNENYIVGYHIIGLYLWVVHELHRNFVDTIDDFFRLITDDYVEYKNHFFSLITKKSIDTNWVEPDYEAVKSEIKDALKYFSKLCWVEIVDNKFIIYPSFSRIAYLYEDEIKSFFKVKI